MPLYVTASIVIPDNELDWRFSPSGGPGGQHANRSHTRAEVTWNVAASVAVSPGQRDRIIAALGEEIRVSADDERSQLRNRAIAQDRLAGRVRQSLVPAKKRRATRPTKGSQRRRLDNKKRRGETKRSRQRRNWD